MNSHNKSNKHLGFGVKSFLFLVAVFCLPATIFASTLYFNNAVDTSWNTLGNWWTNARHTIHSSVFPQTGDIVYVDRPVVTAASSTVTLGHVNVAFESPLGTEDIGMSSDSIIGDFTFYDSGYYGNGKITGNAVFNNGSIVHSTIITGTATFNNSSHSYGTITVSNAVYNDDSYHEFSSVLTGDTVFNNNAANYGDIIGSVIFNDYSFTSGDYTDTYRILGNVTFNNNSRNDSFITGNVVFNDSSHNELSITGNAIFTGTSINNGTINGNACFGPDATNNGTVTGVIYDCNDVTYPAIDTVSVSSESDSGVTIEWVTDEPTDRQVNYGTGLTYTSHLHNGVYGTTHSLTLSGLESCTRYGFNVESTDAASNTATSSDNHFFTTGCTGGSIISSSGLEPIATSTGGTLALEDVTLTVPTDFSQSASEVIFQAHALDATTFSVAAGSPTNVSLIGSTVINLQAFAGITPVTEFDKPLSVTFTYSPSDISGILESSLKIYRYDYPIWTELSSCNVDIVEHTVTCLTEHFSDFALFGNAISSGGGSGRGGGRSAAATVSRVGLLVPENLNTSSTTTSSRTTEIKNIITSLTKKETRSLYLGLKGEDVKALQEYLNQNGFAVSLSGVGSKGSETNYFGIKTRDALAKFQKSVGVKPAAGFFGPITKAYIASH